MRIVLLAYAAVAMLLLRWYAEATRPARDYSRPVAVVLGVAPSPVYDPLEETDDEWDAGDWERVSRHYSRRTKFYGRYWSSATGSG